MQKKPKLFTVLLAGGAICALAGQLHATGLFVPPSEPAVNPPSEAVASDKDRTRARPAPGSLTGSIKARGFWFGAHETPAEAQEPIRVEAPVWTRKELQAIATEPGGPDNWVVVDGSVVNIRSAPGIDASRVGSLERGTRLRVIERRNNWTQVEDPQTQTTGWMHQDFLKAAVPGKAG
jgi:uncharacterized protein YgiM (DUF1202 family)